MRTLVPFGPFDICQGAQGVPVDFPRAMEEVACAALDRRTGQLVELHMLPQSLQWTVAHRAEFTKKTRLAGDLGETVFPRILDAGEQDGISWFSLPLQEGEPVAEFMSRVGGLGETAALELVGQVALALIRLEPYVRLITSTTLQGTLVALSDEEVPVGTQPSVELRVINLGLGQLDQRASGVDEYPSRLGAELTHLLYLLVTGRSGGPSEARTAQDMTFALMPPSLREALKRAGAGHTTGLPDLGEFVAITEEYSTRRPEALRRESLRLPVARQPRSALSSYMPDEAALIRFLEQGDFEPDAFVGHPGGFCCAVTGPSGQQTIVVEPPMALFQNVASGSLDPQYNRLLRPIAQAEAPGLRALIEERGSGFFLSDILAERGGRIDLVEGIQIMQGLIDCLAECVHAGWPLPRLSPSQVVVGTGGHGLDAALRGTKLGLWPHVAVRLRLTQTMRTRLMALPPPFQKFGRLPADAERRLEGEFIQLAAQMLGGREVMAADLLLGRPLGALWDEALDRLAQGHEVPMADFTAAVKLIPERAFAQQFPDLAPEDPASRPEWPTAASSTSPLTQGQATDKRRSFLSLVNHLWK